MGYTQSMANPPLILASKSQARITLLKGLGIPFTTQPADIDESTLPNEAPLAYVKRIALAKAAKVAAANPGSVIIAADTPVLVGRRILQTPQNANEAAAQLRLQSGRRVHVPTVVVAVDATGKTHHKTVQSWVKFKRLTESEITAYLATNIWNHVSGSIRIMDPVCLSFIPTVHGSLSGIEGLPLYETAQLLRKSGLQPVMPS